jgi:NDP-sugar pyrophosphorylase family protein
MAQSARTRLVALANDWRRWEENEREIMALALGLLGHKSLADFVPRKPIKPVILAGGKGTRAGLPGAKVLARIRGMPAIEWVLHTLESIPRMRPAILIVSNYQDSDREIRASLDGQYDVEYLVETELLGTGHAVLQAERLVAPFDGTVLVTEGTQALLRRETVLKSLLIHEAVGYAAMTLPTTRRERPYAYLVRDREGYVVDSRETRLEQAEIVDYGEDNVSVYLIGSAHLFPALHLARERSLDPKTHQYRLGQLGFPNEMARSLHQQQKLVLGLCFADVREAQSIKAAEDALRVERYMAELNGES